MTLFDRTARKLLLSAAVLVALAGTAAHADEPLELTDASFMDIDSMVLGAKGRPNEEQRLRGLKSYRTGHYKGALQAFQAAAYHADKHSQHYLSLMHWRGVGTPPDRVQAYIWADLAAERGSRQLLLLREKMWSELTVEQREQAVTRGIEFYARFGDEVAKPRVESKMRHFARDMTGSRVGFRSQQLIVSGPPICGSFACPGKGSQTADAPHADQLYGRDGGLAQLDTYWAEQDRLLNGTVNVGPLEPVRTPERPKPPKSNGMSL